VSSRHFLVTGGTGFIGSAIVRGLVDAGHRVRSFDNETRGRVGRLADVAGSVEFIRGDVRDPAAVDAAVKDVDTVCHLAYINGTEFFYTMPDLVLDVAVRGMTNVIDSCIRHGVGELILASSSEVYQFPPTVPTDESAPLVVPDVLNPRFSYGGGKIISELMTINYGRTHFKRAVIFRPHNVFGPDMGWEHVIPQFALRMHRLAQAQPTGLIDFPIRGGGSATRSFIFIEEFTTGVLSVIEHGQHLNIYHIGTTREVSAAELAGRVAKCFGREIRIVPTTSVPGETPRRCPDIRKVQALGFEPKMDFQDALERTVGWYAEHAHFAPEHVSGTNARNVL
jgi:nucleoside-diphosphate-sugar epimerase